MSSRRGGRLRTAMVCSTTVGSGRRRKPAGRLAIARTVASPSASHNSDPVPTVAPRLASATPSSPPNRAGRTEPAARVCSARTSVRLPCCSSSRMDPRLCAGTLNQAVTTVAGPMAGQSVVTVTIGSGPTRRANHAAPAATTTSSSTRMVGSFRDFLENDCMATPQRLSFPPFKRHTSITYRSQRAMVCLNGNSRRSICGQPPRIA